MRILLPYAITHPVWILLLCISLFLITTCSVYSPDSDISKAELEELEQEIRSMIGTAPVENASHCKMIAYGSKPCGGPWEYLVYSSSHTDEPGLKTKVDRYNEMEEQYNREHGISSDCILAPKPNVSLVNGQCTAAFN